jgi:hypothetical protein
VAFISLQLRAQDSGWHYRKDDPITKKHIARIYAASFRRIKDGHASYWHNMTICLYDPSGFHDKQISSEEAIVDEKLGTLTYGPNLKTVVKLATPTK